jgi:hypothetical protein
MRDGSHAGRGRPAGHALARGLSVVGRQEGPAPLTASKLIDEAAHLAVEYMREHLDRVPENDPRRPEIEAIIRACAK